MVTEQSAVPTLCELSSRCVASHIPFELVENVYPPVPEQLQLRIAFWSFPDNEEDIRLYSCLANGSADEFLRGEHLFRTRSIKDPLQIGKISNIAFVCVCWNFFFFLYKFVLNNILRIIFHHYRIGFHLSASVNPQILTSNGARSQFNVAVTFDRRKITSCNCTCSSTAYWCAHVVSVCLYRIHMVCKQVNIRNTSNDL